LSVTLHKNCDPTGIPSSKSDCRTIPPILARFPFTATHRTSPRARTSTFENRERKLKFPVTRPSLCRTAENSYLSTMTAPKVKVIRADPDALCIPSSSAVADTAIDSTRTTKTINSLLEAIFLSPRELGSLQRPCHSRRACFSRRPERPPGLFRRRRWRRRKEGVRPSGHDPPLASAL